MQVTRQQFLEKIFEFSEEFRFYFNTDVLAKTMKELSGDYEIEWQAVDELINLVVVSNFDLSVLYQNIQELDMEYQDKKDFYLDFVGKILYPIDDFAANVSFSEEIKKSGGKPEDYEDYKQEFELELENRNLDLAEEFLKSYDEFDVNEEISVICDILASKLLNLLTKTAPGPVQCFNGGLMFILSHKPDAKKKLERALYANGELLTHADFILEGKPQSPTIGNWIQDFIKTIGTQYANNLTITKYITDSENTRRLTVEEKKFVQRLIQVYRNLKFFPECFKELPPERWEILPLNQAAGAERKEIGIPKTEEERDIEALKQEEGKYQAGGLEHLVLEEEINYKKRLEDLKIEIKKYKENSLEWMALNDEIKRLERKK